MARVIALIDRSGGIEYTVALAHAEAERARASLQMLAPSPYRDALSALAREAVERDR